MSAAKHTTGPWMVSRYADHLEIHGPEGSGDTLGPKARRIVAHLPQFYSLEQDNARLIAAAPELLEALAEVQAFLLDRFGHANAPHDARASHVLTQISAALAKVQS